VAGLFASGHIVDLILAAMLLEALAAGAYRRATGKGIAAVELCATLIPGLCLLLALRAALVGEPWGVIAFCLALALAAHLLDLGRRWRR